MIEKMKKTTLLIYHSSKDKFLSELQSLGMMHLETNNSVQSEELSVTREMIIRLSKAKKVLGSYKKEGIVAAKEFNGNISELLCEFESKKSELDALLTERENLKKEKVAVTPFGNFDKEILKELEENRIKIKIYSASKKNFAKISNDNIVCSQIYAEGSEVYFVVFYKNDDELQNIQGTECKIPDRNLSEIEQRANEVENLIKKAEETLKNMVGILPYIETEILKQEDLLHYQVASESLSTEVDGKILVITGFFQAKQEEKIKAFLEKEDVAYFIEEPKDEDETPIKLKNGKLASLFEPVGNLFSLPGYTEIDVVPFFAPFFAFFFGICLGDLGYGLIIVLLCLFALLKVKNKGIRNIVKLGLILGICTGIAGFMLNGFFGTQIIKGDGSAGMPIFESIKNYVTFSNPDDRTGPMVFAILLGVAQLLLGYILNAYNRCKSDGWQGLFQPIGTILIMLGAVVLVMIWMYKPTESNPFDKFAVGPIPLGSYLMAVGGGTVAGLVKLMTILVAVGVVFVLLFNNIGSNFFIRPVKGLWEMYNIITGLLSDLLSYIRLFALGLAGGLLGSAFNDIALMLKDVFPGGIVLTILIMIIGHTLNFLLNAIGSFVHPLRLTFVEFYKAVGFNGGGKPFIPFSNKASKNNN
jgi:V/A-type H+-transporting ATPase subunit I